MKDFKVIDCDGHVEPAVVARWEKYAPAPYAEMLTKMARDRFDANGDRTTPRRGGYDPEVRLADMDKEGIDVTVLFGSSVGLIAGPADDLPYSVALCRAYNNWLADYCSANPDRLKGGALLPYASPEEMDKEARRTVTELGFVAVVVPPYLQLGQTLLSLYDAHFTPIFEEAERLDTTITIHGPGTHLRSFLRERYKTHFERHALDFSVSQMMASMDVICGGLLDEFKTLRFAFMEGSIGWVPWWIDRLNEHFEKLPHHVPRCIKEPSEYLKEPRTFFSCESGEKVLGYAVQVLGEDKIIYASDYPHWDCEYPESVNLILKRQDLSESAKRKILSDNGARLYKFNAK